MRVLLEARAEIKVVEEAIIGFGVGIWYEL